MLQIVAFVREVSDEKAQAVINEGVGATAFEFYPYRDTLIRAGFTTFGAGELIFASRDGEIKFHKCINLKDSVLKTLELEKPADEGVRRHFDD